MNKNMRTFIIRQYIMILLISLKAVTSVCIAQNTIMQLDIAATGYEYDEENKTFSFYYMLKAGEQYGDVGLFSAADIRADVFSREGIKLAGGSSFTVDNSMKIEADGVAGNIPLASKIPTPIGFPERRPVASMAMVPEGTNAIVTETPQIFAKIVLPLQKVAQYQHQQVILRY